MRSTMTWVIMSACLFLFLTACESPNFVPGSGTRQSERQTIDDLTIVLERPQTAHVNIQQRMLVTLTDEAGSPVTGATVYLRLVMPVHPMGMNQPIAMPDGNGTYRADAVYTMEGRWNVTVVVDRAGRTTEAQFAVPVE